MAMTELPVRQKGLCCELELPADQGWMVEQAQLLKALADPTRLAMIWCLRRAEASHPSASATSRRRSTSVSRPSPTTWAS
jgi:hypothetical protein